MNLSSYFKHGKKPNYIVEGHCLLFFYHPPGIKSKIPTQCPYGYHSFYLVRFQFYLLEFWARLCAMAILVVCLFDRGSFSPWLLVVFVYRVHTIAMGLFTLRFPLFSLGRLSILKFVKLQS